MTVPRLLGPQVALVPAPGVLARAVLDGERDVMTLALEALGLRPGAGWPHEDSADLLSGSAHAAQACTWLVVVEGQVVGECGWKGPPCPDGAVEIGYGLARPARGRGVGTEAVALLVAWSEQQPGVRCLTADVLVGNEGSRRLLRRLGFVERPLDGRRVRAERGRVRIRGRHVC
jgi:[ribosomal protein S5]-alanine N-acetyltransferase